VHAALEERRQMLREMEETSRALQITIDRELEMAETVLMVTALADSLQEAIAAGPDGPLDRKARFHGRAVQIVAERPDLILNVVLHDPQGRQIINTLLPLDAPLPGVDHARPPETRLLLDPDLEARDVFERVVAARQPYITDAFYGPVAGQYLVGVLMPIERDGAVVAVLSANILPSGLGALLAEQMTDLGYVASVVDRGGVIIARSRDGDRFLGELATEEVRRFARGPQMQQAPRHSMTADGVEVYGTFRKLARVPWSIAYGAPREVVDAPIRRLVLAMGGVGSLALALFVAASLSIGRRLARELDTLSGDAALLGGGVSLPVRVDRVREVADVRAALRSGVAALAAAEERMRLAVEGSGMATWDIDVGRNKITWAGHFLEMFGLPRDHPGPLPVKAWLDRVHPDDRTALDAQWQASSREGSRFHMVYRIMRGDDGALRWLESFGAHVRDGGQHRFIGVTFDVTERHRAEEQRQLLMREVDHRAKNALAVVQSIVRLTRANDPASYAAAVEGRVRSLARAHDLLARDRWAGASLADVAAQELAAQIADGQVTVLGPPVTLLPEAVQPISMVLHELATNAAKYGALSVPEGHVRLVWRLGPGDEPLRIEWTERHGPAATAPTSTGFGTRLIEVTVSAQLDGSVRFGWAGAGLSCALSLPRRWVCGSVGAKPAGQEEAAGPEAQPAALTGARVLVVEDEAVIGEELATSLSRAGCRPIGPFATVPAAEAALARERPVDAAILDINLGRSDSLPLAQALTAAGVSVVVVTGYGELPAAWADQKGLSAVFRKPVNPDELVAALGRALRRERAA
jgi:PAS domain S-box-containing protein